jgi:hypothetical protein
VLADETPPERSELEPTWQTYSIPESVAREHFGLTLHAELCTTAPFGESLRDILELAGDEDFVCRAERAEGERPQTIGVKYEEVSYLQAYCVYLSSVQR